MRVASLHVYPVKGARGITLDRAELVASGIRNDRRFMVIGEDRAFITQREHPRMALVDVALEGEWMKLSVAGRTATLALRAIEHDDERPRLRVRVWDDEVDAVDAGEESAELFSEHLGQRCRLVFMPANVVRPVEPPHGRPQDRVGFADAFPVLIASLASLADLNTRLVAGGHAPVPMDRFRPNIVVEGGEAFAEEQSPTARIGSVVLRMPKRCSRCEVTTVDQQSAATSKEPLRTLAGYRKEGNKVYFAMNAIPDLPPGGSAVIRVGDPVVYE